MQTRGREANPEGIGGHQGDKPHPADTATNGAHRKEALTLHVNNAETENRVLRHIIRLNDKRDRIARLIEFGMVIDISFMIDAIKSGAWIAVTGLGVGAIILGLAVALIQWWPGELERS